MMNFTGTTAKRTNSGFLRAASIVNCEVAALYAVTLVEAGGTGYDSANRPKMLFEPHIFYGHLSGEDRVDAVNLGLAYAAWGTRPYPKDSYPRLENACDINETAALMSASWGLPQILGENFKAAGYASVQDMVGSFVRDGEDEHLLAMARFITANSSMREALRTKNWTAFARAYNGAGYSKNHYDTKLAAAYHAAEKISFKADTPSNVATIAPSLPSSVPLPAPVKTPAVANTVIAVAAKSQADSAVSNSKVAGAASVVSIVPAVITAVSHVSSWAQWHAPVVLPYIAGVLGIGFAAMSAFFGIRAKQHGAKAAVFEAAAAKATDPSKT